VNVVISVSESAQKAGLTQCEELAQNVVNHGWLSNPALVPKSLIHYAIFHSDVKGRRNPEVYRVFFLPSSSEKETWNGVQSDQNS
jgi:hypothetical protein